MATDYQDKKNGLIYKDGDINDLYNKVKRLLDNESERKQIAVNAYNTMISEWNAKNAADRFISLLETLLVGDKNPFPYSIGVCSKAEILKDDWYNN
jgi:spore maturation protein CgeB